MSRCRWLAPVVILSSFGFATAQEKQFTQIPEVVTSATAAPKAEPAPKPANVLKWDEGTAPHWIWGESNDTNYFLRTTFKGKAKHAIVRATADNQCTLFVNGKKVLSNNEWADSAEADITSYLQEGENELLADARNNGGIAAFVLKLILTGEDGKTQTIVSDKTWTASTDRKGTNAKPVHVVAPYGSEPWGKPLTGEKGAVAAVNNDFQLLPGFQIERLFTVPRDQLGSWVCITFDHKGRLIASDQGNQGLCRITLPAIGSKDPVKVEKLDVKITAAQGMLYAFDALYLSVNGGPGSGFYRAKDTNGDDQFDEVVKLADFNGGGEHGPHGLVLSPDKKHIVVACGNHTRPPQTIDASRIPTNWSEDHLLPRQWDANGHARGILAPGGWIAQTDPEGKTWEVLSMGYRNQYDIAYNGEGELFSYDADMEWDFGTPWYRPTRVNHATSGSELGWRSGTGKWPAYYLDSLPAMVDIGPGSPVGITFGYGTKFPAKYQKALFICDWTFGTMYAIHMQPHGSTYTAVKEEFVARTPLPLTDNAVGPDGALYFTIGGRGTQSELYRVTYVGSEPTAKVEYRDAELADQREIRRKIESFHRKTENPAEAIAVAYPHLSSDDRFTRYAARIALEHQPVALWQDKVLGESNVNALLNGIVGLARQADKSLQPRLLAALEKVNFASLSEELQLDYLRTLGLVFVRQGEPDAATAGKFIAKLDPFFPGNSSKFVKRELVGVLTYLQSPTIVGKTIAELQKPSEPESSLELQDLLNRNKGYGGTIRQVMANSADQQKFRYAFDLRNAKVGWTMEYRKAYYTFLNDCRTKSGGNSFQGFIRNIEADSVATCTDAERLAIEALGLKKPFVVKELPKPKGPGKAYTVEDILKNAEPKMQKRNFKNGEKMFAAARCVVCHRFFGDGGATGPDLSQAAGRFQLKDLAEAIIEPSKVVSDQYKASTLVLHDGKQVTGKVASETPNEITIVVNPEDASKVQVVKRSEIEEIIPSPVSLMPKELLNSLNENEVYDLLAYLLSRGDPNHNLFK